MTTPLISTPNIGPKLRDALAQVEVHDLETLLDRGVVVVWGQLRAAGLFDCVHSLLALEGAVRGVRWTDLDPEVRAGLRAHVQVVRQ